MRSRRNGSQRGAKVQLDSIDPVIAALAGGVLLLLLLLLSRLRKSGKQDPDYLTKVRRFVARGDYRRAGEIQFRHGKIQEAFNLFERGDVHDRAADCAERLGFVDRAALQAEKAGQLERAARLYLQASEPADAARLFQRVGNFREAAEALDTDLNAPPMELAQLWENAFLDSVPSEGEPVTPTQLAALHRTAERAAENYKRVGEVERAAHFYELCDREDVARAIRKHLPSRAMDKLDQVRDRLRVRLKSAMEAATSADFAFAPAVEEGPSANGVEPSQTPAGGSFSAAEVAPPAPSRLTEAGLPTRGARSSGEYRMAAASSDPVAVPTTLLDARQVSGQPHAASPLSGGFDPVNLPPEAEDADLFPTDHDGRPAADVLGLDSDDLGHIETVFDSPALRHLLDPQGGEIIEGLQPSDAHPAVGSGDAVRVDSSEIIALGDHDPYLDSDAERPAIDRHLVSAVVDEVLSRQTSHTPTSGIHKRPSAEQVAAASVDREDSARHVPTVGRFEVIHRTEAPPPPERSGISIDSDRYELHEVLGEGGMGIVYRARDSVLDREVALKFLPQGVTTHEVLLGLFEQEAKSSAQLNHPNIVTVHDFGVLDGRPFICMELIEGQTVSDMLAAGDSDGLPVLSVMLIAEGLLSALAYAHKRQIIHRDIKPSNVMRTHEGMIKLMDFGIAKLMEPDKTTRVAGTPAYMAPEQMVGKGIDHRTDLFAVGVTLYEALTGRLPYEGLRRDTPVEPARRHSRAIPKRLDKLVLDCLSPEIDGRPSSADEVRRAIEQMRRQIELHLDRELGPGPVESGAAPSVDMIDAETLRTLLSQLAAPESEDAAEAEPLFRAALTDPRAQVRADAVSSYPQDLDPALRATVTALLGDESEEVRVAVIDRLGSTGEHHLAGLLLDKAREAHGATLSTSERRALYNSLIEVAGDQSEPHLESLFESMVGPDTPPISSIEEERAARGQLKDLMDALSRFDSDRAHRLASRVRERQRWISRRWRGASSPLGGSEPDPLVGSDEPTRVLAESHRPSAEGEETETESTGSLPREVEDLLRDYLRSDK